MSLNLNIFKRLQPMRVRFSRFLDSFVANEAPLEKVPLFGKQFVVEPLMGREFLRVQGDEVIPFLQGLITNDMELLERSKKVGSDSIYTMFLNKAGRVLYDAFIYRTPVPNNYLIECDKSISNELRRHLQLYRVRRKIDIHPVDEEYRPWIVFNPDAEIASDLRFDVTKISQDIFYTIDPRLRSLGMRVITKSNVGWTELAEVFSKQNEIVVSPHTSDCNYRLHRYRFGVGEGVQDLPPGKCFPLEANCDYLHGVSFQKGCYIGQELTARVHHTGVVRKRLMPLRLTHPIEDNISTTTVQEPSCGNIGSLRGVTSNRALGLLRVEKAVGAAELMINGHPCFTEIPKWWPMEIPK